MDSNRTYHRYTSIISLVGHLSLSRGSLAHEAQRTAKRMFSHSALKFFPAKWL